MIQQVFNHPTPLTLESGIVIQDFPLAYTMMGKMNADKSNVVWVFHALSGNSNPYEWWHGLVGDGCLLNATDYCIVCVNMPGSCYGSVGPLSINPATDTPYYHQFPLFTTRDMVRSYQQLKAFLGIEQIYLGIGGSMGGQQLLEWAIEEPTLFKHIIPIATNAFHSPWGIAFNKTQRLCIEADPTWKESNAQAGMNGMKIARSMALLSYRHYDTYQQLQAGITPETENLLVHQHTFHAETYQVYQGEKLAKRFNAFSYYYLSKTMDTHHVGRGRDGAANALGTIKAKTLAIGITTDILFPPEEQAFIAKHVTNGAFIAIQSLYGHDGFLLEHEQLTPIINQFLNK